MRIQHILLATALVLVLAGCAPHPPKIYAEGKSAADIPAEVHTMRLDDVSAVETAAADAAFVSLPRAKPTDNDREVDAVARNAAVSQFENFGIHVIEDDSRKPDLRFKLEVLYVPEMGLFVHRALVTSVYITDPKGDLIFKKISFAQNANGLLDAMLEGRDEMVTRVTRAAVQDAVKEMNKGTAVSKAGP